jgi:creatinine amidohydrolase
MLIENKKYLIDYTREVRYEYMYGRAAAEAIHMSGIGYLPVGCLERHGDHLPMGLDVMKAHGIWRAAAQALGGVVFPPHYYSGIHAMTEEQLKKYTGLWGNVYTDATAPQHLIDVIRQLEMAGIKKLVLYTGHYPEVQDNMIHDVASVFNAKAGGICVLTPFEWDILGRKDHAGLVETSLLLFLERNLVNMAAIGPENHEDHGWPEEMYPEKASVAQGEEFVMKIIHGIEKLLAN